VAGSHEEAFVLTAGQHSSSESLDSLAISPITPAEVDEAVNIFLEAFHQNVRIVYGDNPKPAAMHDVWSFIRETEPDGFLAARTKNRMVGYAIFISSVRALQHSALVKGKPLIWALRALSGQYGIRWLNLSKLLWNKLLFVRSSSRFRSEGDAQLLNIAVAPAARGLGVAKALIRAGLAYLAQHHVREVRLEVRPDNHAALAVYHANGFVERGRTRDAGGEWLVMTAQP
jgi:[ribosomal protein S18]-alanine N-acetyltransferase